MPPIKPAVDFRATTLDLAFNRARRERIGPPIAPAPAPTAPIEATRTLPALYIVEYYQLTTMPGDVGLTRNIVQSINVAAGAKQSWIVRTRSLVKRTSEVSTSVLESQERAVAKNLSKSISESAEQAGARERTQFKFDASFHGELDVGLTGGSTDADVHAAGSTSAVRDSFKNAVDQSVDQQVSATEQYRTQQAATVSNTEERVDEGESIQTYELDNTANRSSVTYMLCQLAVERMTALSLVNVQLGLLNARTGSLETTALSNMDTLLARAFPQAEHRSSVRKVLLDQLSRVLDYRDEPRQLVEKYAIPTAQAGIDHEYYRVVPELSSEVSVKRPDGSRRTFVAPGIVVKTDYRVTTVPQLGLARGVAAGPA